MSDPDGAPDYLQSPLGGFLELVASAGPAPAGGSACAVAVALAAGLSGMAARLSTRHLPDAAKLAARADALRQLTAPLARADAEAYGCVLDARRADDARDALSKAADVPLGVAEAGAEVAGIAARLAREGNPNLQGDAVTAALLAEAGASAAIRLAQINLSTAGIEDERLGRAEELARSAASARRAAEAATPS